MTLEKRTGKNSKNKVLLGIGMLAALTLGGCASSPKAAETAYHKIDSEEAKRMLDEGGVTVVDVRTPQEYAEGHIPGAVNVPNEEIGSEPPALLADKEAVLLIHCRTGVRSKAASDKLVGMGYQNVYDFGGIVDWPYETVKEE